ncbi:hypothetical protein Tco_1383772 [Tanacetum coccineum]
MNSRKCWCCLVYVDPGRKKREGKDEKLLGMIEGELRKSRIDVDGVIDVSSLDSREITVVILVRDRCPRGKGSTGVDGPLLCQRNPYANNGCLWVPKVPPSPDYIPGPEEPQSPPPLDFVPEPMYPEYIPQEDEILPAEEQPLPAAASPTANSPGYVPESDSEEEPEEDDEDPEEDPADYPADRDDDEEEEEPFGDDADDEDEDEDEEEEEEEHPAPADSVPPVHRMTARISIRDEPSISLPPREEVKRLLALTTPPPSPLTPLSSPLPHIPSPPPNSPTHIEIPESCLPLRKRVHFASPTPSREVRESLAAGAARQDRPTIAMEDPYGFVDMVDVH